MSSSPYSSLCVGVLVAVVLTLSRRHNLVRGRENRLHYNVGAQEDILD